MYHAPSFSAEIRRVYHVRRFWRTWYTRLVSGPFYAPQVGGMVQEPPKTALNGPFHRLVSGEVYHVTPFSCDMVHGPPKVVLNGPSAI